ncbi:MAG: BON domain-containing protein [Planctomycetota bacterium]
MTNKEQPMKFLLFGTLCGVALGCNQSNPPASVTKPTTERPTTITANRPAVTEHPVATTEPVDRTNTGLNVRDRESTAKTPIDQNENKADIKITADIRKRVVATEMSVNAHNVKIITQDGKVTLRGPVKSEDEKKTIDEIAVDVAGANNVDSQLEVNNE